MSKKLRPTWLMCNICHSTDIEVTTELGNEGCFYEEDPVRCLNCNAIGTIHTDSNIAWFEANKEEQNAQLH